LVRKHPVVGVGPGRAQLVWINGNRQLVTDRYSHDEYLQVAAEQGITGLVLVAILLIGAARLVRAGRRDSPLPLWAGAVSGVLAFCLQSGFDFLWHVPVVPIVAAVLVGLASPSCP